VKNIDNILIVGGGSSGWITAAFLIKTFPEKNIKVLESPNIPIVGVGESTLADITNYREYLEIDEKDFMEYTNASYKMSIKFTDFYNKDAGSFHYPFRFPDTSDTDNGLRDWMEIKAFHPETPNEDFVRSYFPHSYLFENNKFSKR
jgi:tryptophan halogenase